VTTAEEMDKIFTNPPMALFMVIPPETGKG